MLMYVWIFRIFPIVLICSTSIKGCSRILVSVYENKEEIMTLIGYINGIASASNGFFNSIACLFFFRDVLKCCCAFSTDEGELSGEEEGNDSPIIPREEVADDAIDI